MYVCILYVTVTRYFKGLLHNRRLMKNLLTVTYTIHTYIHTHTHTHIYIYIYTYMCVCVCVCIGYVTVKIFFKSLLHN